MYIKIINPYNYNHNKFIYYTSVLCTPIIPNFVEHSSLELKIEISIVFLLMLNSDIGHFKSISIQIKY